ncbi:MAG: glycosyltransferase family 2 protein [Candidatus Omnitrophota bacterium]|jgi:glycosyltransferase involved in cell wall biosynthesis|nr:MAG: glycosyltransferase family 2 protein [Candidatus Omnitrophota bacterium]
MSEVYDSESLISVSIVIPCFNEVDAVGPVIDDVRHAMGTTDSVYEILVVDDCSTDATAQIAKDKGVRVIERKMNGGSGASRKTGLLHARGEIVVMLDADGTYTAADIPKMLALFPEWDQVNGARTSEEGTMKFFRVPAKWCIRQLAIYLSGVHIPDLNTGLKAFKRDIMLKYLWVIPDGFSCVTTMTLAFLCNGYSVTWIPTQYHKRIGKSKFHPIKDTSKYFSTVVRMVMYFNPLRVFMPIGLILFLLGSVRGLIEYFCVSGSLQEGDIILTLGGVLIGVMGLLADLIVAQGRSRNH